MNPHLSPVGKPAPPRPRSTESFIVWMTWSGSMASARGSAVYPPCRRYPASVNESGSSQYAVSSGVRIVVTA
jgi:hypothetical protein